MVNKKADKKHPAVEVMPGVEVPKALIDAAVEATCDPAKASLVDEARERAKAQGGVWSRDESTVTEG